MYIYLVRHGETDWNNLLLFQGHTDIPLNKKGLLQAKLIGKELSGKKIDAIISSDLMRAMQTAKAVKTAARIRGEIKADSRFRERDYGDLEGKNYDSALNGERFNGENDKVFFARVNRAFNDVIKHYGGRRAVAVICHGGVVRAVLSNILGVKKYKRLRTYNGSISEIFYNPRKKSLFVTLFNSISHLSKKDREEIRRHLKGV